MNFHAITFKLDNLILIINLKLNFDRRSLTDEFD